MELAFTAEAYARMLKALLPPGRCWRLEPTSVLSRIMLGAGEELARLDQRGRDLLAESDPRVADELLPDFEDELGLDGAGTVEQRRGRVIALLLRRQRFRPADYQRILAALLGQDAEDVVVIERGRAFAELVGDDREIYRFFIYRDPDLPGGYDLAGAQEIVDAISPSHTKGHVIESVDFRCDDPHSLCDRDLLGV